MAKAGHRHRGGSFPLTKILAIVIGVHVAGGLGLVWLANTTAGQELAKKYNIELFTPSKPPEPEQAKHEPPPPPPPPKARDAAPPPPSAAPKVASALPPAPSAAPTIGGGGAGPNWGGGKFAGAGLGDGPDAAFRIAAISKFRSCIKDNLENMGPGEVRLAVDPQGSVKGFRMSVSTGNRDLDAELVRCAGEVQRTGLGPAPPGTEKGAIVSVRLYPSY